MATWTMLPVGIHTLVTGRVKAPHGAHESAIFEGVLFVVAGLFVMILFVLTYRRVAVVAFGLFAFLALATIVAAALDRVSHSVFTGMGAYVALIWFYLSARRELRDVPTAAPVPAPKRSKPVVEDEVPDQVHEGQLVFYMLDSEEQELAAADRILACAYLTGLDDFYSDYDPYLTVLEVAFMIAEADALLAGEALDVARRHEISVLKQSIRANGRSYVGYQIEDPA